MATQYICDRCKKPIEKVSFMMTTRPVKYFLCLERATGLNSYDLCVRCMLDIQKCLDTPPVDEQT